MTGIIAIKNKRISFNVTGSILLNLRIKMLKLMCLICTVDREDMKHGVKMFRIKETVCFCGFEAVQQKGQGHQQLFNVQLAMDKREKNAD